MSGPAYYSGVMNVAKNEDWIVPFIYGSDDGHGGTTPIDLTGSTLKMEIRRKESDNAVAVSVFSPDNGIAITGATNGTFTILIDRQRLSQLQPGDYVSDLVRELSNGTQERIWEGICTVVEGTTR